MSDFNPLDRAKINTHRSSFDMSAKNLFTCKVGELIPVYHTIAIPGDKFRIKSEWFTRTVPVNTAAYTRIKEYYDFFAVPLRLIHRQLPQAFTQMDDYSTSASSPTGNTVRLKNVPYTTLSSLSIGISSIAKNAVYDDSGFPGTGGAQKLLRLLDYGPVLDPTLSDLTALAQTYSKVLDVKRSSYKQSYSVNLLPLAAYNKVYFDFFSNTQWEPHKAYTYNFDYWTGSAAAVPAPEALLMRYANYPKDYFMGLLPNSQYGDVAVLPPLTSVGSSRLVVASRTANGTTGPAAYAKTEASSTAVVTSAMDTSSRLVGVNSDLSALSIRATEYLQRWKEVVQFSSKDYADQIEAQFGIKAPEYMGNHSHYIGGWSNVININEVVNTNLDTEDSQASIAGKGVGSGTGHELKYDVGAEHCVIIGIYHAVPLLDWSTSGPDAQLTVTAITDFPQPAFDQLGLQPMAMYNMFNANILPYSPTFNIGYNLRYWQWKSKIDRVHTGLEYGAGYTSWAAPFTNAMIDTLPAGSKLTYKSFKVRPVQLNTIFLPQADTTIDTDQLICNVNIQCYKVSNLDRNGLPF